ncbi:MAG: tRNA (adenosine(37)-N6)-threonylcarbamoyltransferase complex dimerization subunit type 1 TsaB [Bdellovibrionales bacterium RIFCSPHIGHO2_01_FULL_40_29]|nr:MAG: tRNA (adenosine(37)-N6)-threonylcarbamoyltransferase complex dimerization subunit type 1 TsaB [Bdellovibrionales bacterium RIFCSPHIGHO2_01_FULL_40_29]OFZ33127.1 MAG: tRNA (adenosine(37)-N6)-threonylcarbamoyltransferase complex dimerization subunit type 1 TsaB [Bdellovibrionales bacterium RIFCSPHIGHO2_02_FULL_40_15]
MIFLICDSSTLLGSVALFEDSKLLSYRESMRRGSHSDMMNVFVHEALDESQKKLADVDLFVSGVGPGSFTGIRVSLNMIKTFAFCHNKQVLGINSLETLAFQTEREDLPIVSMINAFKNMVYIGTYLKKGHTLDILSPPQVVRVQNLKDYIQSSCLVVGDGYGAYSQYFSPETKAFIQRPNEPLDEPRTRAIAPLVIERVGQQSHWSTLLPLYLRASEAEENLQGIKFQPLV